VGEEGRLPGHPEGQGRRRRARHAHCAHAEELPNLFHAANTEAANAFGNGELYMEKFIERPRHIEFQVLADEHGNVVSLFERECSIQRRHQKLIEEAPSLQVTPKMREEIGQDALPLPEARSATRTPARSSS
jgi:acetyl/propionyl-CoA carboxylase alpha subunit